MSENDKKINIDMMIDDMQIYETMINEAEKSGVDFDKAKIITFAADDKYVEKASNIKKFLKIIDDFKKNILYKLDIDSISDEEFEKALEEYHKGIEDYIDKSNIIDVKNNYKNIHFDNLEDKTCEFIVYGDILYKTVEKTFGNNGDYSSVILQWCRAVELELRNKIYKYIDSYDIKNKIISKARESNYYKNNRTDIVVSNMLGFYKYIKEYNLTDYIFDNFINNHYNNFKKEDFYNIVNYTKAINIYRRESAHSECTIDLNKKSAIECKEYITASKKILEILSKLEKKNK